MKSSQWVLALAAVVVMVGLLTFAMVYYGIGDGGGGDGGGGGGGPPAGPAAQLTFDCRVYPPRPTPGVPNELPLNLEARKGGWHDFWFENANDAAVTVGLTKTDCERCTGADLFLLPASQKGKAALLRNWPCLAVALLQGKADKSELAKGGPGVDVPAGAVGWVRLYWDGEKAGPVAHQAELWSGSRDRPTPPLQVLMVFREPLRVAAADLHRGRAPGGELQAVTLPFRDEIVCWSATRRQLPLAVRVLPAGGQSAAGADLFTVGAPVRVPDAELPEVARTKALPSGDFQVLAAYRLPVTLAAATPDGKRQADYGPFRRHVELSLEGEPTAEKARLTFEGRVLGPLEVGKPGDNGVIRCRDFDWRKGTTCEPVAVRAARPGLKLDIDTERTSPFLKAVLRPAADEGEGEGQAWSLEVKVLPERVQGRFPDRDDAYRRDSAVYIRIADDPRAHRVPVVGDAQER
jgi:hypothetical protein